MAILECLQGYVGVAAVCTAEPPASGLYMTGLPGISLENIDATADNGQKNFMGVWADVEKRGLLKFRSSALMEMNKCFSITDLTVIDCLVCDNMELFAVALWYLLGSELCYERMYTDAINRYTTIDKKKAAELRSDFLVDFQTELTNAMRGIDLSETDCVEHLEAGGNVRWIESAL